MKINQISEFKKLPTSEKEESQEILETKSSIFEKLEYKEFPNLIDNIWFLIFVIIVTIIFIYWISTELYWILFEYNIMPGQSKHIIIINSFDKKHNLTHLLRSLIEQSISSYEIIITKNYKQELSNLAFEKFKKKNVNIKFIQYGEKDTNLKIRIDSASAANGEYILFLNPNDYFSTDFLKDSLKAAIKDKLDITQYNHFHDNIKFNEILHQPKLFDSMFFNKDEIKQNQFHLSGKIIKKTVFIEAMKDIDLFYLENNNNRFFDETMIILKLFKKAESFMKIRNRGIKSKCEQKLCIQSLINKKSYKKKELKDILIYIKFLIQYTDKKVLEKRMAAKFFIETLVQKNKTIKNFNKELVELLDEIIDLYSNCDLINEYDINLIKEYRKKIKI